MTTYTDVYPILDFIDDTVKFHLLQIFMVLGALSEKNYLVGGCVRDILRVTIPKDYDLVTDAPIEKLSEAFKTAGWRVEETGKAFLVLSIGKDGKQYEIANFRKDGVYLDGRRPNTVEIGTIEDDAKRRDFTINALYLKPQGLTNTIKEIYNYVIDPTGRGIDDLSNRILRFVGKPKERIREDYLRVIRFYRFLAKGFSPDPKSLRACRELFNEAYPDITPERVRAELEKFV
jgi:tRNA nucleotidyltransferase/poly(A) polymerase